MVVVPVIPVMQEVEIGGYQPEASSGKKYKTLSEK
jgi:hypothetical protein